MRVYLACPYSRGDVGQNVHNAIKIADMVVERGHIPYIPVWTHFWHLISPKPWEFWMKLDEEFLKMCDCVFRTAGESVGADREVELAKKLGIPVIYNIGELDEI